MFGNITRYVTKELLSRRDPYEFADDIRWAAWELWRHAPSSRRSLAKALRDVADDIDPFVPSAHKTFPSPSPEDQCSTG